MWIPTFDSALGNQAIGAMSRYPTQSHYPDTEHSSPSPSLLLLSVMLGSDMYQLCHWFDSTMNQSLTFCRETSALPIRPSRNSLVHFSALPLRHKDYITCILSIDNTRFHPGIHRFVSVSRFGRTGDSNLMGSNTGRGKPITSTFILVTSQSGV